MQTSLLTEHTVTTEKHCLGQKLPKDMQELPAFPSQMLLALLVHISPATLNEIWTKSGKIKSSISYQHLATFNPIV